MRFSPRELEHRRARARPVGPALADHQFGHLRPEPLAALHDRWLCCAIGRHNARGHNLHRPVGPRRRGCPPAWQRPLRRILARRTLAHMIKTLASDRADQSFGTAVLQWRSRRCRSVANAHRANAARKCLAIDPIPITDEVLGRALPTACLRAIHSAVGCAVTGSHTMHRRSCRRTSNRTRAGMKSSGPRTGQSRRSHLHDLEEMFSSPATAGAFVGPCTWRRRFGPRRCRA
jgi:hypothetical protein